MLNMVCRVGWLPAEISMTLMSESNTSVAMKRL